MTAVIAQSTERDATSNVRTIVTAAGIAGAVASAATIVGWFAFSNLSRAEAARAPITVIEHVIAGLAFVVLAVSLPSLTNGARLPRLALSFAGAGCAFIAVSAWVFGSLVAHLADQVSAAEFDALGKPAFLLLLLALPMMITCVLAFPTLAIIGWRRNVMPRAASLLLFLAGLTSLTAEFALPGLFAGIAFAWTARSAGLRRV